MESVKFILRLISETYKEWSHDRAARLGAALAYYALFSLAPLLVLIIAIAGRVYGEAEARIQIVNIIAREVGFPAASTVEQLLGGVYREPSSSLLTTVISSLILIYSATNLFSHLRDALNTLWNVRRKPHKHIFRGIMIVIRDRFLSAVMVIILSIALLAALALTASLTVVSAWFNIITPNTSFLLQGGNFLISFGLITVLFAIMFKIVPDVQISWQVVWVGALVSSLLFTIGAFLIGLYLGYGGAESLLGAAGSLVILLIWISYSAQIFFFGAKFALVYASAIGKPILPAPYAAGFKLSWLETTPTDQE